MSDLVLGIRLTADGKDLVGAVKVSAAEIDKMTGATKRAASESEKLNAQQKNLGQSLNDVASRIGAYTIGWNVAVNAITSAAGAIKDYIKEAALLNARHETMGVVLEVVGRNAGYSRREMDLYTESVRKNGITMIASRENVIRMVQANLDLATAGKLARAAQDAAVIANINSSEAFTRLIYAIQSGQPEMLRTMGINVSFEAAYKKMAAQLKVTTEQLTEQEKTQARANATLQGTIQIAGTYEAAMGTAGKMLNSLARYTEDLKVMRGEVFNDALVIAVNAYTDSLKDADTETRRLADNKKLQEWGRDLVTVFAWVGDIVRGAWDAISQGVESTAVVLLQSMNGIRNAMLRMFPGAQLVASLLGAGTGHDIDAFVQSFSDTADANLQARLGRPQFRDSAAAYFAAKDNDAAARAAREANAAYEEADLQRGADMRRASAAGSGARPSGKGEGADPYPALLKHLKEKLLLDRELTEVNKLQLDLEAMSAKQRAQISPAEQATLERTAAQVDAQKLHNAAIENTAKNEEALARARTEAAEAAAAFDKKRDDAIIAAYKNLDQMEFEVELIGMTNEARERAIALRALETSGIDKQSGAYADLQERVKAVLGNKEIADKQKQFAEDMQRAHVVAWQSIERTAHDTFISIFDSGKSAFDRLRDALKNGLYDLLYQMTLKKWIINISGSVSGAGVAQSAFGASGGGLDLLSSASNLASAAGIFGSAGAYAAAVPGLTSAAAGSQAALLAAQTGAFGAEGLAMTAAAGGSTLGGGITAAMAAIPGWGWAALGAAAIGAYLLSDEGDAQRTGNWSAGLGEVGRSTKNKWFDASTGAGPFAAELAAQEQQMVKLLELSADQTSKINAALDALSGNVYGFGMERTDWMQSGAAQAIAADRLRAIADSLGMSVESLAAKMADAQKQIDIAPQKLQLEIDLMKLQGKQADALAAERKRELDALDPLVRGLQEQIYAEQDLAAAANDAGSAVSVLAEALRETQSAVDAQIGASRSAGQAARATADSYRGLTATLADTVRTLRGGDLSPLLPRQKLDEARANVEATYARAMTQDAAAIAALPQLVTDFVTASRAYNASSDAFTADFNRGVEILAKAGVASNAAAMKQDYMATLYEAQTGILGQIKDELAKPSPDTAILTEQKNLLATIGVLLKDQTGVILTGNSTQDVIRDITAIDTSYSADTLAALIAGDAQQNVGLDKTVALLQQLLYLNVVAEKAAAEQSVFAAADAFVRGAKGYAVQNASSYFAVESTLYQGLTPTGSGGSSVKALYDAYKSSIALMLNVQQQLAALERIGASTAFYDLPGHAAGGVASGWSMVGEQGPELVNFSAPGRVYTADQTRNALGGAANDDLLIELKALRLEVAALRAERSLDADAHTTKIATAVEESAQTIGRTVARAAEAATRA